MGTSSQGGLCSAPETLWGGPSEFLKFVRMGTRFTRPTLQLKPHPKPEEPPISSRVAVIQLERAGPDSPA